MSATGWTFTQVDETSWAEIRALLDYWTLHPPPGESLADIVRGLFEVQDAPHNEPSKMTNEQWEKQAAELAQWSARLKRR